MPPSVRMPRRVPARSAPPRVKASSCTLPSIGRVASQGSEKYSRVASRSSPVSSTALMTRPMGTIRMYHPPAAVEFGYRAAVALVGTSRLHWMATRGIPAPAGYVELICSHAP